MRPRASLVIPNLDCPLVDRAVAAARRDRGPRELEVIVVGRDEPGRLARGDGIRFLETPEPVPPATARNLGVDAARGELLLFTDADCEPEAGWADRLLRELGEAPVAGGGVRFALTGNRWAVADNIASFHDLLIDRPPERSTRGPLGSLNLAVTREAWARVGPFDEELPTSEDLDWVLRARAAGLTTAFQPEAVVAHAAVRRSRLELVEHARWYGRHFAAFRAKHPGVFDRGPSWTSRRRLAWTAPLKSVLAAITIFRRHPLLRPAWRVLPAVARFKLAWYRAVVAGWPAERRA